MQSLINTLKSHFTTAIRSAFPDLQTIDTAEITASTQPQFGDYQCNSAMKYTKLLGINPRVIAETIIKHIDAPFIKKMEIAGPGFINIWIDPTFITEKITEMLQDSRLGINKLDSKQKIIVELSSPNTAKELHVGHLRSTIIGDALARLFEFLGHDVLRLNHVGDWGTQFGMLITYIKDYHPKVFNGQEDANLTSLVNWYKASKKQFDEDADFKKRSQQEVVQLQSGNKETFSAWEKICEISRVAYQEIYDLLDVKLQERGESFYNPMLAPLVEDLEAKGLIEVSSGAKCIFINGFTNRDGEPLPFMVQKSDGGYNYDTTDLATIRHRTQVEKADRIIYVVDSGQATHFQMLFQAAIKAGYLDPSKVLAEHVPFGLVLGPDGKKFKTRSGETERLMDLLETAVNKAKAILIERQEDKLTSDEIDHIAQVLGINAIKYADLSCQRSHDYTFSYDRMLRFEGNTAAFLMYAYVRVAGIKRKIGVDMTSLLNSKAKISLDHPSEIALGMHLLRFQETLDNISQDLYPHRLCEYLFNLAEKFNAFFRDCKVAGSEEQSSRLLLAEVVARVLKQGMEILGLKTIDKM